MNIRDILTKRILVLDGAMGSLIQNHNLTEQDFRGEQFKSHKCNLIGNNDILSLTKPQIISNIHNEYLKAGADIIETNTLNANSISQAEYQLEGFIYEMNKTSASIARSEADHFSTDEKPRFVAGSVGPTNKTASISPDINRPEFREVNFDSLKTSYMEQIQGLIDGGIDFLLIETIFDLINCKAAVFAANAVFEEYQKKYPIVISITISPNSGRILSGQTIEAFYNTFASQNLLAFGLNCSAGTKDLIPHVKELNKISEFPISLYPNAGFPDESGNYLQDAKTMASLLKPLFEDRCFNMIGGCCGTTPEHIKELAHLSTQYSPRISEKSSPKLKLSGLQPFNIDRNSNFTNIGERTNVAGSKKFARLISKKKYDKALKIALKQITSGAQIIDINMDDPLINAQEEITIFLNMINSEPEISKVPIMIDSSDWDIIETGLKCLNGKGIVNSISLKDGEKEFLRKAELVRRYGAAVVVMAFDEKGQAVGYQHKIDICLRSYNLLINELNYKPEDIIFDPNILTIGTGIKEHSNYAVDFIKAVSWIKQHLPHCGISGGISNLSFAFRGNNYLREAIHSVFLYHAIKEGLNMGIVNAGKLLNFDELENDLRIAIENLIFNKTHNATENLLKIASQINPDENQEQKQVEKWRELEIDERIKHSLIKGDTKYLNSDCEEIINKYKNPVLVIEGPIMDGITKVGELFSSGKMFLPQVVKTARVMKNIVDLLLPYFDDQIIQLKSSGKVLLATVKGDVHDIGKNIVGIILGCNNYEIIDLGVGTSTSQIIQTALKEKVDIIGLSGLITPSLSEMIHVVSEMEKNNLKIPVILGGATTSKLHTAIKIAPLTESPVIHASDASDGVKISNLLMNKNKKGEFLTELNKEYHKIRSIRETNKNSLTDFSIVQKSRAKISFKTKQIKKPEFLGNKTLSDFSISTIADYINWNYYFIPWGFKGKFPEVLEKTHGGIEARKLFLATETILSDMIREDILKPAAALGFYPADSDNNNNINIYSSNSSNTPFLTLPCLRQQHSNRQNTFLSLSDYIPSQELKVKDYIGVFALNCNTGTDHYLSKYHKEKDDYRILIVRQLINRLTEAFAEFLHLKIRTEFWAYNTRENLPVQDLFANKYQGVRCAPGYSSIPDHSLKSDIFKLLDIPGRLPLKLTENYMIDPPSAICGICFDHPDSKYFSINSISKQQYHHYLKHRNLSEMEVKKSLENIIE